MPSCLAASAKFPSAQAESGRQWNTRNPSPQNPVYEDVGRPVQYMWSNSLRSPCRRQPHPGPRQALPRPGHPLPERDPDAVEVGRREDADPVADDPVGRRLPGRGDRGHPAVPLRSPPRETPAHLGVLGTRVTRLTVQKASSLTHDCKSL